MDTSVNTLGYDITSIAAYSGWIDNRAGQNYSVSFRTVGSATFSPAIITVDEAASGESLVTTVVDNGGALLATGVDAIRIEVGVNGAVNVWREVDAFGIATIPEPSGALLAGMAGMLMLGRRRR